MNFIKKIIGIFLAAITIISLTTTNYTFAFDEENNLITTTTYDTFIQDKYGLSDDVLDDFCAIRSFQMFDDGTTYVLDAEDTSIKIVKSGNHVKIIDISFCIDPQYLAVDDEYIYVYDYCCNGKLFLMNINGELVDERELPEEIPGYGIEGFYNYNDNYYLLTYDKELISLDELSIYKNLFEITQNGMDFHVLYGDDEWMFVKSSDNVFFNPIYVDENDNLYIEKSEYATGTSAIMGETYLLKYDNAGNEVASMRLNLEDYSVFPKKFYEFLNDEIYILEVFNDYFQISNVTLGNVREESMISAMKRNYPMVENLISPRAASSVTKTRAQVESTAYGIINCGWTVNSGNKTIKSGATLPKCVNDVSVGGKVSGIPYCWGGYNDLSAILSQLGSGYMAGNVNKQIISGTTGYDCSGFISYCYGLGKHIATGSMLSDISLTKLTSVNDLQLMDLLHKSGHAMLFKAHSGTSAITVYEATSEGEQKTRSFTYTHNTLFTNNSYTMHTPWK